jgi:hypothetical protein
MMEPISGLAALYQILRRKVGGEANAPERMPKAPGEASRPVAARATLQDVERQIRGKLKGSGSDTASSPAAKRWVIASLLSWELDSRLQNEAKFKALVRNVHESIEADPRLRAKLERAMEQLSR